MTSGTKLESMEGENIPLSLRWSWQILVDGLKVWEILQIKRDFERFFVANTKTF